MAHHTNLNTAERLFDRYKKLYDTIIVDYPHWDSDTEEYVWKPLEWDWWAHNLDHPDDVQPSSRPAFGRSSEGIYASYNALSRLCVNLYRVLSETDLYGSKAFGFYNTEALEDDGYLVEGEGLETLLNAIDFSEHTSTGTPSALEAYRLGFNQKTFDTLGFSDYTAPYIPGMKHELWDNDTPPRWYVHHYEATYQFLHKLMDAMTHVLWEDTPLSSSDIVRWTGDNGDQEYPGFESLAESKAYAESDGLDTKYEKDYNQTIDNFYHRSRIKTTEFEGELSYFVYFGRTGGYANTGMLGTDDKIWLPSLNPYRASLLGIDEVTYFITFRVGSGGGWTLPRKYDNMNTPDAHENEKVFVPVLLPKLADTTIRGQDVFGTYRYDYGRRADVDANSNPGEWPAEPLPEEEEQIGHYFWWNPSYMFTPFPWDTYEEPEPPPE